MGMVVRTNVMANNAFRQLGMNNKQVGKSLEKLASGFRINRAGDDAAGLAISERMKAQIKGLDAASANSQDGISVVQTAEGALNEVHDMLNRMVELSTKAANGIYTETQRGNYSDEVEQLKGEIDRIAKTTDFNGQKLLDGTLGGFNGTVTGGGADGVAKNPLIVKGGKLLAGDEFSFKLDANGKIGIDANTGFKIGGGTYKLSGTLGTNAAYLKDKNNKDVAIIEAVKVPKKDDNGKWSEGGNWTFKITINPDANISGPGKDIITDDFKNAVGEGLTLNIKTTGLGNANGNTTFKWVANGGGGGMKLQVGDVYNDDNILTVAIDAMDSASLGLDKVDISSQASAGEAIAKINSAIDTVSKVRAGLGAMQNRLEHTINNLDTTSENMDAAHSRIRDTDMAKEMMNYTKINVLTQSAQAMLAQANQQPQAVLQLLQ